MKKLAIIIPAYKQRFLRETLDSIAKQNNHDFTVYIGDDASPYQLDTCLLYTSTWQLLSGKQR